MAHALFTDLAIGESGTNRASFVKGYGKGFQAGYAFGFTQGSNERAEAGRREGQAALEDPAEEEAPIGEGPGNGEQVGSDDLAGELAEETSNASAMEEEDVFYDAKSTVSTDPTGELSPEDGLRMLLARLAAERPEPPTADLHPATTTTTTTSQPDILYGIPLAHMVRPITPDWSRPLHGPRPPYPRLANDLDIYTLHSQGATIVENPWRVIIGPISASAREDWKEDKGKGYLRFKLGSCRKSGVHLCEMVQGEEGRWYVLAMFTSQESARNAVELFGQGYPCGGSIMWAWTCLEEE
ncbi:hypothetical protein C8A03DRAFT_37063 [Achaetomium macrosporum]|uniref:Uncharacterized protein n=1 Tax=Achaetomium macrosporum TaxID=79813 RepID=A0AAN7C647_9PEZI|nr:hypothetical protein C8A03DRAFT_37063 [Achaetomium macrosporum]